jgi:5'-nucleotidase
MNILLSNDDGYRAEGLRALRASLMDLGKVTVVAPDRNRSGASNSLTLEAPLRVIEHDPDWYAVNGTPTDCVHLAISGFLQEEQHLVVSGINDGANLGDDVHYSGTVAAAMEARFLGKPTIAFSLALENDSGRHFATAARVARELIDRLLERPLPNALILNVNIPDRPYDEIVGWRATRLGFRHRAEQVVKTRDPRGERDLLGRRRRPAPGRGARHGFPRDRERLRVRDAAAGGHDAARVAAGPRGLAGGAVRR